MTAWLATGICGAALCLAYVGFCYHVRPFKEGRRW